LETIYIQRTTEDSACPRNVIKAAFFDARQLFDERGNLLPIQKQEALARDVQGMKVTVFHGPDSRTVSVELPDKIKALEQVSRAIGLFPADPGATINSLETK
jgi:hypothetical protein